ncbi:MAG: tetratricopeptide repeat protein [Chthoniobacterales bacterium]
MNSARAAARGIAALLIGVAATVFAQRAPEVRRAQPADEAPPSRAVPTQEAQPDVTESAPPSEEQDADKRQLEYANGLFARKMYDLAAPEYEKFLGQYPNAGGRPGAAFHLGECYYSLGKKGAARTSFQTVVDQYGDSDFAGPAAYRLAETAFTQKDYATALPLFHKSAAKSKEPTLALSARYFEARCLESLKKNDEALGAYQQVIDTKNPNPYREDSRVAAATIAQALGRKADAFRNFEALSNETQKPALKAEATVRAGLLAADLTQPEKGKIDKGMADKAAALLQKGTSLPEAARWHAIAEVGLLRLQYQLGNFEKVVSEYKRAQDAIPEETRAEMMLVVANSQRQLNHTKEADALYREIVEKYPAREEAKDAQYQRLINLYNSDSPELLTELDSYLQSNPSADRAVQAKLLKAEHLYRKGKFADAVPLYAELRAAPELSPKLRGESAHKLVLCCEQLKQQPQLIEALTFLIKNFPDHPQITSALTKRAVAYQDAKDYDGALGDLNALLGRKLPPHEREGALQQKALILGQKNDVAGMADTFRQLLKEFPKSAAAAQANYFIGKAAFETRDYKGALGPLDASRKLNKEQYYSLATLRIISCFFYLKDRPSLMREIDSFLAADPNGRVPAEILESLGLQFYGEKNYAAADRYLTLLSRSENVGSVKQDFWFYLADADSHLNKIAEAENAYQQYIQVASDPAAKAKALLALGSTKIAAHKPDEAQRIAEEIMGLQPEGRVNAEARLLAGDVEVERQRFEEAGKAYMAVALLNDDPAIAPRALQKAASAYAKAGRRDEADRVTKQLHDKYPNFAGS